MVFLTTIWLMPGVIRLGHTRISVFGFFAAAGVIGAIWLSQRTARMVGLKEQKLWDAGVFLVFSAFVLSRILLIVQDFSAFRHYPLIVLSLPSLTPLGVALSLTATLIYLEFLKLPLRGVLDAWAPCGALLAAVLAVAHFVEGTDAGMPTSLPWGVITPGDTVLGKVHPVQLYIAGIALVLMALSYQALKRDHEQGRVGAWTMVAAGVAALLMAMLTQPVNTNGNEWLEPEQIAWTLAILVGALLLGVPVAEKKIESKKIGDEA
jgi:phosphatidylglycerol:prolipoprotein diacylglycerol transferase